MGRNLDNKKIDPKIEQIEQEVVERGLVDDNAPIDDRNHPASNFDQGFNQLSGSNNEGRSKPLILLIDDDPIFREMVKQALELADYDVMEAADGNEGLKIQFERSADLIISDIIMPEKEGIETVMEIRERFPAVKIIVISGGGWYGTEMDFDMAEKLGAVTLDKPFEIKDLMAAVRQMLA
jgi:CheY-like chemotaxis protein